MTIKTRQIDKDYHKIFADYLQKSGLKHTKQRRVILDAVLASPRHVDTATIANIVKNIDKTIGIATIYRTLKMMTNANILIERHFSEQRVCFEFIDDSKHHDHLICNQCGEIIEFLDQIIELQQEKITKDLGFKLTDHKMELFADCLNYRYCNNKKKE